MARLFLGTMTTGQFLVDLDHGLHRDTVVVVATSNRFDAEAVREAAGRRGSEGSVHVAEFDDVTDPAWPGALDEETAWAIYGFLASHDSDDAEFLFVCDGAVSRSSGMLCAWMRLCGEDDLPVWVDAAHYSPNTLVYARLLAAGGAWLSQDDVRVRDLLKRMAFAREFSGRRAHAMRLFERPWRQVASGEKRCELRRLDEKRRSVSVGDLVAFSMVGDPDAIVAAYVLESRTAASFEDLLGDGDVVAASGFRTAEEALATLGEIYGDEPGPVVALFLDSSDWTRRREEAKAKSKQMRD